jgi:hypothetical protein
LLIIQTHPLFLSSEHHNIIHLTYIQPPQTCHQKQKIINYK